MCKVLEDPNFNMLIMTPHDYNTFSMTSSYSLYMKLHLVSCWGRTSPVKEDVTQVMSSHICWYLTQYDLGKVRIECTVDRSLQHNEEWRKWLVFFRCMQYIHLQFVEWNCIFILIFTPVFFTVWLMISSSDNSLPLKGWDDITQNKTNSEQFSSLLITPYFDFVMHDLIILLYNPI